MIDVYLHSVSDNHNVDDHVKKIIIKHQILLIILSKCHNVYSL